MAGAKAADEAINNTLRNSVATLGMSFVGFDSNITSDNAKNATGIAAGGAGAVGGDQTEIREISAWAATPDLLRVIQGVPSFLTFYGDGINATLDIIYAFTPYKQYALQHISHCLYDKFQTNREGNIRRIIDDSVYLEPNLQDFTENYRINNINYQPLANQIEAKWVSVEYPARYYRQGGWKTSYMRDEVYAFFIRWVYNTGDKSASYHIPGRYVKSSDTTLVINEDVLVTDSSPERWRIYNTASVDVPFTGTGTVLPDGGIVLGGGDMGYWESEVKYDRDWETICN